MDDYWWYDDSAYLDPGYDYATPYDDSTFDWDAFYADYGDVGMGTSDAEPSFDYAAPDSGWSVTEIPNESLPGDAAWGWKYYSDGTVISRDGKYYYPNEAGEVSLVYDPSSAGGNVISSLLKTAGSKFTKKDASGNDVVDWNSVNKAAAGLLGAYAGVKSGTDAVDYKVGYKGSIPKFQAVRQAVDYETNPNRRAGGGGRQYFTDMQYVSPSNASAAQSSAQAQANALKAADAKRYAAAASGLAAYSLPELAKSFSVEPSSVQNPQTYNAQPAVFAPNIEKMAADSTTARPEGTIWSEKNGWIPIEDAETDGGVMPSPEIVPAGFSASMFANGGIARLNTGRYLRGNTDGMTDEISTTIDGSDPAALSHGEFVIPADVVSHLGNGNSEAGAEKLHEMMDNVRQARTGTKRQGKQINPNNFMPGGLAKAYAEGGAVKKYATGSTVTTASSKGLADWAGPYVTDMLGQADALASQPYQAYTGPLTAGASPLQQQAFTRASGLQTPAAVGQAAQTAGNIAQQYQGLSYTPATQDLDAASVQKYMNPYLQAALEPQLREARRQSQISGLADTSKMTQAGAFGGSRQAILQAEADRNLQQKLSDITGAGYANAYQQAVSQFNAEQARKANEAQFGANYGLQGLAGALSAAQTQASLAGQQNQLDLANLSALSGLGSTQRGIEAEGIAADKAQFEEQRDWPYKMLQLKSGLLGNLPLEETGTYIPESSGLTDAAGGAAALIDALKKMGIIT